MRFGVLGPLEVWSADGVPVNVAETKVRMLLADLLAHRGCVVPADRLATDLWAEHQPANPSAALRTKVSRLRRALGGVVRFRPPGYVLAVEPEAVDLGRFRILLLRARRADDPRVRVELLTEALDLWRGPAFADFADHDFVRAAAEHAEELRRTAVEELAQARWDLVRDDRPHAPSEVIDRGGGLLTDPEHGPEQREWLDAYLADMSVLNGQDAMVPEPADPKGQWSLGFALCRSGKDLAAGERLAERALAGFTELGDQWGIAATLSLRANLALLRGDLDQARADGERAWSLFQERGDQWGQAQTVPVLAELAESTGDLARAERLHDEGLRMAEELHLWTEAADRLIDLGRLALLRRDLGAADNLYERARKFAVHQRYQVGELHAEVGLARAARMRGDLDAAEYHLRGLYEGSLHGAFDPGTALILAELGFVAELRGDADTALALHTRGLAVARHLGDPLAVALAQEGLAGAHSLTGEHEYAARLLDEAAAARAAVGGPPRSVEWVDVDRIRARLRAASG